MIGWWVFLLTIGAIGLGALTAAAIRKYVKRKMSRRAYSAVITDVVKKFGGYHVSFSALDDEGDYLDSATVETKKISDEIYEGNKIYLD